MSDEAPTDAELLAAAAGGDDSAFALLVRRYIRPATLLAAQVLGDRDDAEDIVQDAFVVVRRKAPSFDPGRPFGPWFFAIVRRLAANRRARDSRRARLLSLWGKSANIDEASPPDENALVARLDAETATRAMKDLSPMQRACFELVTVRGLAIDEVAAMHGIAESTVRQHVFRARERLRGLLDQVRPKQGES